MAHTVAEHPRALSESAMVAVTRVTPDEVRQRMGRGEMFTFVDSRNPKDWGESNVRLPGAIRMTPEDAVKRVGDLPRDRTIITYCTWKNEHSSARVAQTLAENGFRNVHPLYGGFDAWRDAGYPLFQK